MKLHRLYKYWRAKKENNLSENDKKMLWHVVVCGGFLFYSKDPFTGQQNVWYYTDSHDNRGYYKTVFQKFSIEWLDRLEIEGVVEYYIDGNLIVVNFK